LSEDSPSEPSIESLVLLQEKHPQGTLNASDLPLPEPAHAHLSVVETDVRRAVSSFPAGSAGGPDGMKSQHLKALMNCREN